MRMAVCPCRIAPPEGPIDMHPSADRYIGIERASRCSREIWQRIRTHSALPIYQHAHHRVVPSAQQAQRLDACRMRLGATTTVIGGAPNKPPASMFQPNGASNLWRIAARALKLALVAPVTNTPPQLIAPLGQKDVVVEWRGALQIGDAPAEEQRRRCIPQHYWFFVTFRDRSREPNFVIRSRGISTLCGKSAPRKVTKNHII